MEKDPEALLLLSYILTGGNIRETPTPEMCSRYHQALRAHNVDPQHTLSRVVYRFPILLGFLDTFSRLKKPHSTLQKKLLIAAAICECHPLTADWLLPRDRSIFSLLIRSLFLTMRIAVKASGALLLLLFPCFCKTNVA